jgi:hypothetical protein
MITTKKFPTFQTEILALFEKHGVDTFFFGTVTNDPSGDLADLPILANVTGSPERGIPEHRMASVFVDNTVKALIQLLMRYTGLTLHQAVGAVTESVKAGAFELQQQQAAFLRGGSGAKAEG